MKLFLIRHGQTTANVNKQYAGQQDVPLTEEGRQQAERIRPILGQISFDKVYSSDLSRAINTQMLALPGVEGERTALLREYDVGSLVGLHFDEVRRLHGGQISTGSIRGYADFGGESTEMVCQRMRSFLSELEADACENVAAFVHNGIMNSMLEIVLGVAFDRQAVRSGNCAIHVFEFDGTKWRLIAWNYKGEV